MHENIYNIIVNSGIGIGIFIAIVYYANMKKRNESNIFFPLLMLVFSFVILHSTFIVVNYKNILMVNEPFLLLVFPFIYLYCKSITENFKFAFSEMKHFALFVIIFGIEVMNTITGIDNNIIGLDKLLSIIMMVIFIIQAGTYILSIYKLISNYDVTIEEEFSEVENLKLTWLKTFLFIFAAVFIILAVYFVLLVHGGNVNDFNKILALYFSTAVFVLGYFTFTRQYNQVSTKPILDEIKNKEEDNISSDRKKVDIEDKKLFDKLINYMEKEKPYLKPDITLTILASNLGTNRNTLSRVINTLTGNNFFNFINEYRVNEVKEELKKPQNQNYTLLAIAFQCGFNSKSSFNSVFKKFTSLTPSQYMKSL